MSLPSSNSVSQRSPAFVASALVSIFLGVSLGLIAALTLLPDEGSQMAATLVGTTPKAYWYLSRASAFVALGLLWVSMMLGLLITDRVAKSWPGAAVASSLHEFVSLLGLAFAMFHALILLGDRYINYQLAQILMPFGSINYHPVWVGLGQLGFYAWAIISATFYIRQLIGSKAWKFIHYASFFNFVVAIMHGVASGTDSTTAWAQIVYWLLGGSVLFFTVARVVGSLIPPSARPRPAPAVTREQVSPASSSLANKTPQ